MKAYNSMLFHYVRLFSEFGESEVEELTTHFQSILTSSGVAVWAHPRSVDHSQDQTVWRRERESLHMKTWPEITGLLQRSAPTS